MVFVIIFLTSVNITSGSIHVAANGMISFSLWLNNSPLFTYITSSLFIC